jgi:hypothetical protein
MSYGIAYNICIFDIVQLCLGFEYRSDNSKIIIIVQNQDGQSINN